MTGAYKIVISDKKVRFELYLERQITVIKGDSATGKTTLVDMVRESARSHGKSGVTIESNVNCNVVDNVPNWAETIAYFNETVLFLDEGCLFVTTPEFAKAVEYSNNYFVIISREPLYCLPYSVKSVFEIRVSKKYAGLKQVYNELNWLYAAEKSSRRECGFDTVLVEDSNSGFQFFEYVGKQTGFVCKSAAGKSNIYRYIGNAEGKTLVIVDGAAFGPEMDKVLAKIHECRNYFLLVPESFEWLVLKSGVIKSKSGIQLKEILTHPEDFVETTKYFSWEQYFTRVLTELTSGVFGLQYTKAKLTEGYLSEYVVSRILSVIKSVRFDRE